MMLKYSPSFRAPTICNAAFLACSIFSPRIDPDRSITSVTSRLITGRSASAGTPSSSMKYPPLPPDPTLGSGYAISDAASPSLSAIT